MKRISVLFAGTICFIILLCTTVFAQVEKGNPAASYYDDMIILPDDSVVELERNYIPLFINWTLITEHDVIIKNDRALVPLRLISQELGASVEWDGNKKEITIIKALNSIVLTIDKDVALVNNTEISLDHPPILYKDTTYVPLRFVAENLDAIVSYAPTMSSEYVYYYDSLMPLSPANTIIRDFSNIIIDEKYDLNEAISVQEAMKKAKEVCLEGLVNFAKGLRENLANSGENPNRFDSDIKSIEREINRMQYLGEVSRFYKFTIGPYDILYDKFNDRMFFVKYSSGTIVEEVDVNDKSLYILVFIVG